MTSKNLFFKRMKEDLGQRIWIPVVFFIVCFLTMDMPLLSELEKWRDADRLVFEEEMITYLLNTFFSPCSFVTALTVAWAIISALSEFDYMHSPKKLDVYHSIPIKREHLFIQQYCYGVIYYLLPILLHVIISLGIIGINGLFGSNVLIQAFAFTLLQFLIFMACYAVVIVAICLTGTAVIGALGSVVLLLYSLILGYIKNSVMWKFFVTLTYYDYDYLNFPAFSPVHLISRLYDRAGAADLLIYSEYVEYFVNLIMMTVIYTLLALFLYKKRPTEAAGNSMAFTFSEPIIKTMVVIPLSFGMGCIFDGMISNGTNLFWFVFGCIFGFVIGCPLMEIIFRKDVKAVFSHPLQLVFNGACVVGGILILQFDLLGYDTYVPAENKVESYGISVAALPAVRSQYEIFGMESMEIRDNESVRKLIEYAAANTRSLWTGRSDVELSQSFMSVKYNMKNGKTLYRDYRIATDDPQIIKYLEDLHDDMAYKVSVYPILDESIEKKYENFELYYGYSWEEMSLTDEQMHKFVETYRQELKGLSFEVLQTEYPVANMVLGDEHGYYLYPSFAETISLLEEYGANFVNEISAKDVTMICIQDSSREQDDHDGLLTKMVELEYSVENGHEKQIEQIISGVQSARLIMGSNLYLNDMERYIDITVYYNLDGEEQTMRGYFKKGEVPEFLMQDIEEAARNIQ